MKLSGSIGSTWTWKTSSELKTEEFTETTQTHRPPEGKRVAVALWRLVNVYTLIRGDDKATICQATYVEPNCEIETCWPEEARSSIRRVA